MNLQKIGDNWKAHQKIYQMSPSASNFINLLKRYKQNKGIYAVLEEIQQPVLPHGRKMGFKKKAPYNFFCNHLLWVCTWYEHVKPRKKWQYSQNEHEGMDSEQCRGSAKAHLKNTLLCLQMSDKGTDLT